MCIRDSLEQDSSPNQLGEDFWEAFAALDRIDLFEKTLTYLKSHQQEVTIRQLAEALPPTHDLETLTLWLTMAREAGVIMNEQTENISLLDKEEGEFLFTVPTVTMSHEDAAQISSDQIG